VQEAGTLQSFSSPWPIVQLGVWPTGQAMRQALQAPAAGTEHEGMLRAARRPAQEASIKLIRHRARSFIRWWRDMVIPFRFTAGEK